MNRFLIILLCSCTLVISSCQGISTKPDVRHVRWGMTKEKVWEIEGAYLYKQKDTSPLVQPGKILLWLPTKIAEFEVSAYYYFKYNWLVKVALLANLKDPEYSKKKLRKRAENIFVKLLSRKYGKYKRVKNNFFEKENYQWKTKRTKIILFPHRLHLEINYEARPGILLKEIKIEKGDIDKI